MLQGWLESYYGKMKNLSSSKTLSLYHRRKFLLDMSITLCKANPLIL